RQRLAAVVTLALVAIDAHFESAGIGHAGVLRVVLCLGPFVGPYVNVSLAEGWPASKTGSGAAEKPADYNTVAGSMDRIGGRDWALGLTCSPLQLEQGLPLGDQALLRDQPLGHSARLLCAHRYVHLHRLDDSDLGVGIDTVARLHQAAQQVPGDGRRDVTCHGKAFDGTAPRTAPCPRRSSQATVVGQRKREPGQAPSGKASRIEATWQLAAVSGRHVCVG